MRSNRTIPEKSTRLQVSDSTEPNMVKISLVKKPKSNIAEEESSLVAKNLKIYKEYCRGDYHPFNPHCWPVKKARSRNPVLEPHVLPKERLQHLTGVPCLFFWELVDRFSSLGCKNTKDYTLPSKVASFLIHLRQGSSYSYLQDLLLLRRNTCTDTFWELLCCYKSLTNEKYTFWNNVHITNEEKDVWYQKIYSNMDPLFIELSNMLEDPWKKNRQVFIEIIPK